MKTAVLTLHKFVHGRTNGVHDVDVLALGVAADVVGFADATSFENQSQSFGMIVDEQPVANVPAIAIERQRNVLDRVRDEQRDELRRIRPRPEVVRRTCDGERELVRTRAAGGRATGGACRGGRRLSARLWSLRASATSPEHEQAHPSHLARRQH